MQPNFPLCWDGAGNVEEVGDDFTRTISPASALSCARHVNGSWLGMSTNRLEYPNTGLQKAFPKN
jgi:hypothetical protein